MSVFVLDKRQRPLMPCSEKRARKLLQAGRARVHRVIPFTIRLRDRHAKSSTLQPLAIKLDPGSKTTGIALVRLVEAVDCGTGEISRTVHALSLFELQHRGRQISESLTGRRAMRRRRRGYLRYRAPRFLNRGNKQRGWLAPSLQHRVNTVSAWVERLRRWSPVTRIEQELVRFDMQALENPEIAGVEYQQGTLAGYEVREYLLNKWNRLCAYCGAENVPLNIDHIEPRARGGSNRVSNLTLACQPCNQAKGAQAIQEFSPKRADAILAQVKRPLKDAAAVNSTRWVLLKTLKATGLPVSNGSGGQTKYNRVRLGVPKAHALDALCVGQVDAVYGIDRPTLTIKSMGRGQYARTKLDKYGFPRGFCMRQKRVHGFQTGDQVRAVVPKGKYVGIHVGRVAVRVTGSFAIQHAEGKVDGVNHRYCQVVQRADGYGYFF